MCLHEQGIRPASLQKVTCQDLAEFIALCISPIVDRPHARQLLKHNYFDSVRHNAGALKLGMCALAPAGGSTAELLATGSAVALHPELSQPSSVAGDILSGTQLVVRLTVGRAPRSFVRGVG